MHTGPIYTVALGAVLSPGPIGSSKGLLSPEVLLEQLWKPGWVSTLLV